MAEINSETLDLVVVLVAHTWSRVVVLLWSKLTMRHVVTKTAIP